jgi:transcriptional regulator MraZ
MLRGNCPAKIDAKGRLKIPNLFRRFLDEKYGREFFVTSLTGDFARVYPMPVWLEVEKKLSAAPTMNPSVTRYTNLVNFYGQPATMDDQGRILIHPLLRLKSGLDGSVAVLGNQTYVDVWSRERFEATIASQPLTDEDRRNLADLGL